MNMKSMAIAGLLCIAAFTSCKKDSDSDSKPNLSVNSNPEVSFKVDGTRLNFKNGENGWQLYLTGGGSHNPIPDPSWTIFGGGFDNGSNWNITFNKGTLGYVGTIDSAAFVAFFPKQSISYDVDAANGVSIDYTDESGTYWSTSLGSQSGSTFTIDDRKVMELLGDLYVRVKISYTCTMYDGAGNSIAITEGVAVVDFEKDII